MSGTSNDGDTVDDATFEVTITLTPSGGSYGITDYTIGISVTQLTGPTYAGGGTLSITIDGPAIKYVGDAVGAEWCTGKSGSITLACNGVSGDTSFSLGTIDSVIEDTAGVAGGFIEAEASGLGETGFTEPYDDPGECSTGFFHYEGEGVWGMRYYQNEFMFTGLTVDDWYCLTIVYEVRAYGAADWDGAWEVTVQAGFQATAASDGPGWIGLPYTELAWEIEWRLKEYTLVNTGASEDCGGAPP